jgi:hypothetical protein
MMEVCMSLEQQAIKTLALYDSAMGRKIWLRNKNEYCLSYYENLSVMILIATGTERDLDDVFDWVADLLIWRNTRREAA